MKESELETGNEASLIHQSLKRTEESRLLFGSGADSFIGPL